MKIDLLIIIDFADHPVRIAGVVYTELVHCEAAH